MCFVVLLAHACILWQASAQLQQAPTGVHNVTVPPQSCSRFRLGSEAPQRASYSVVTLPTFTGGCLEEPVLQALPQTTEHLAWASYDEDTACSEVLEPTIQQTSFGQPVSLDFVDITSTLEVQGLTYHICGDVTWSQGFAGNRGEFGPVDTFLWFYNPCDIATSVTFNISQLMDAAPAEHYCERLRTQNEGEETVVTIVYSGQLAGSILMIFGICLCTSGCTSCCCCAREKCCPACSTPVSRACLRCWGSGLLACGCGWCMGRDGGIAFYTAHPKRAMLFWTFGGACLASYISTNLPAFDRPDTINPYFPDTRATWDGSPGSILGGVLVFKFLNGMLYALAEAVTPFGAIVLSYSDPLRDKSFCSKAVVTGTMIILGQIYAALALTDAARYYDLWEYPGQLIILQAGRMLMQVMTLVAFISFVHTARIQQAEVKRNHEGQLPHIIPSATVTGHLNKRITNLEVPERIPIATVVQHAACSASDMGSVGSGIDIGSGIDMSERTPPEETPTSDAAQQDQALVHTPIAASIEARVIHTPSPAKETSANDIAVAESVERRSQLWESSDLGTSIRTAGLDPGSTLDRRAAGVDPDRMLHRRAADLDPGSTLDRCAARLPSQVVEEPVCKEEAAAAVVRSWRLVSRIRCAWDSVREDSESGFKYSMFVGASLLVTFITLSASLLRALHLVHRLAECSEAESKCLYVVQRFIYKRLVSGFVKVDIDTLELQASGACRVVALEESASQDAFHRRWQSSLVTSEVLRRCMEVQYLEGSQVEHRHPHWLEKAKYPLLVGGHIGFLVAYCLGLYTIFHVARAYKKLELKLKAARLVEVLWQRRTADISELACAAASTQMPTSSAALATATCKSKLGRDIVEDYKLVKIGQSAYFTGTLVSTCFIQLWLAGLLLGSIVTLLAHPLFWELVREEFWWPVSIALIFMWHLLSQFVLNNYITDGKRIKWPFWWLFLYVGLSAGYCVVAVFLALWRLIHLTLTSIVALSRLDSCLFTVLKGADRGYASFLAMALMLHSFQDCLQQNNLSNDAATTAASEASGAQQAREERRQRDDCMHM